MLLGENTVKPEQWRAKSEQQAQMARVLGAAAGAVFTGKVNGVYSGANAAEATFRYNYLSHKQKELMDKDLAAAKTPMERAFVKARWGVTSQTQNGAFLAGMVSGVPAEFIDTAQSAIALMENPAQAIDAFMALMREDDVWSAITNSVKQSYVARLDAMKASYQKAGVNGAYSAGLEFGQLMTEAATSVLGVAGAAKYGAKLTVNGIKALEKAEGKIIVKTSTTKAGAGGNWNVLDEVVDPNVIKQATPSSCGAACGEMLLKDRGVLVSQVKLGTELKSVERLVKDLNKHDSNWSGGFIESKNFDTLNNTGSWSAMMWDQGNKIGHWVVVKGVDNKGNVLIHDPWKGTSYKMTKMEFTGAWNEIAVFKQ